MKSRNLIYSLFFASTLCVSCQQPKESESKLGASLNAAYAVTITDATKLINAYQGLEVRWFFTSEPQSIRNWFAAIDTGNVKNEKGRVDYYLKTGYAKMSFKIREGKTEIKVLDQELGAQAWAGGYKGVVQLWYKWSPVLKSSDSHLTNIFSDTTQFIPMGKDRLLIKYSVGDNGEIDLLKASRRADNGCQVEYTTIHLNGKIIYSFAFEAFGDNAKLKSNLDAVVEKIASEVPISLEREASYSYPALLMDKALL